MPSPEANLKELYDDIALDFSGTRQKPWPETAGFLDSLWENAEDGPGEPTLLDLGCGNGRNTLYALEKGFTVIALDFSLKLLDILRNDARERRLTGRLHLINADFLDVPLQESSVDSAISIAAIHHLATRERRDLALWEWRRVMRPGGRLLISVWAFDQRRFRREYHQHLHRFSRDDERFGNVFVEWKLCSRGSREDGYSPPGNKVFRRFYHLFTEGELPQLCERSGFTVLSEFRAGDNYYAIVER